MARRLALVASLLAFVVPAGVARADSIWTPVASGTGDTISAIVYQSPTRLWYATTNGTIGWWSGTAFHPVMVSAGEDFTDLAFQPGGPWGYAVAVNGDVWQTGNGGQSWSQLPALTTLTDCSQTATPTPVTELNAVVWAGTSTAYLLGDHGTLQKSSNAASAAPGFTEINKNGSGTCLAQSNSQDENLTDATFLPSNPLRGLVAIQDFGGLFGSSNGFASGTQVTDNLVNNFQGLPRIAQDAANPNRIWEVDHAPGGGGCGELCLVYSNDGATTRTAATFPKDANPSVGLYDISSQGRTEVTAGSGGEIFTSNDGADFYLQRAGGVLATENWRAEDAYDAAHAAVGGVGGALAVTSLANTLPGAGTGGGASAPTTRHVDGATLVIYRVVVLKSGALPVKVASKGGRRFVVTILTGKGHHRRASARATLRHGGHQTIRVRLPRSLKRGRYVIRVSVSPVKGRGGGSVSVVFTLK